MNDYNDFESEIKRIFFENGYEIEDRTALLELDSLQFISIICDLEDFFKISVADDLLVGDRLSTFNDFCEMVVLERTSNERKD